MALAWLVLVLVWAVLASVAILLWLAGYTQTGHWVGYAAEIWGNVIFFSFIALLTGYRPPPLTMAQRRRWARWRRYWRRVSVWA